MRAGMRCAGGMTVLQGWREITNGTMTEWRGRWRKDIVLQHSSPTLDSLQLLCKSPLKFHFSDNKLKVASVSSKWVFDYHYKRHRWESSKTQRQWESLHCLPARQTYAADGLCSFYRHPCSRRCFAMIMACKVRIRLEKSWHLKCQMIMSSTALHAVFYLINHQ